MNNYYRNKEIAIQAALKSEKIIRDGFLKLNKISFKDKNGKDYVTDIDKKAEKVIIDIIKKNFPTHNIVSEETGKNMKNSKYTWFIDPIDGTTNFVKRIPLSTTCIALVKNKQTMLSVVNVPMTKECYWTIKSQGAYRNNQKIIVGKKTKIEESFACIEWWSRDKGHQKRGLEVFNIVAKKAKKIRYLSSTAWDICHVASGEIDFHICDTKFLDLVAPKLILEEAGGILTNEKGNQINIKTNNIIKIISSNKNLNKKISILIK